MKKGSRSFEKKFFLPTILALSVLAVVIVRDASAANQNYYPPIVAKIADRFNLNIDDVQKVFDEERDKRRAEMFARLSERLDDLVEIGKITPAQKELILDKHEEMKDAIDDLSGLSFEERRQKIMQLKSEFREWMEESDIDVPSGFFRYGFSMGHRPMMDGN